MHDKRTYKSPPRLQGGGEIPYQKIRFGPVVTDQKTGDSTENREEDREQDRGQGRTQRTGQRTEQRTGKG